MKKIVMSSKRKSALLQLTGAMVIYAILIVIILARRSAQGGPVTNSFSMGEVDVKIVKDDDSDVKSVKIRNDGSLDSYVRANVIIHWAKMVDSDGDGMIDAVYKYDTLPDEIADTVDEYYHINTGTADDPDPKWIYGGNGMYYWTGVVTPYEQDPINGITKDLIVQYGLSEKANYPEGYSFSVDVVAQAVQAVPSAAVKGAWGEDAARILGLLK